MAGLLVCLPDFLPFGHSRVCSADGAEMYAVNAETITCWSLMEVGLKDGRHAHQIDGVLDGSALAGIPLRGVKAQCF